MKKIIATVIAATVLSSSVFAGTMTSTSTVKTDGYVNKTQAYEAGFDLADSLGEKTPSQLGNELHVINGSDVELNNVEVSVEEFAKDRGEIEYRAVLDVNYSYDSSES